MLVIAGPSSSSSSPAGPLLLKAIAAAQSAEIDLPSRERQVLSPESRSRTSARLTAESSAAAGRIPTRLFTTAS